MKEVEKIDLAQTGSWLAQEVEIRVARKWLVLAGVMALVLLMLAFD
ncbi:hypothetical protein ACO1PK_05625 [Alishewanella sp. d11]